MAEPARAHNLSVDWRAVVDGADQNARDRRALSQQESQVRFIP